mgnify:CR=1 FL=1
MRKHICYYMRENIMMLAAQFARATMLVNAKMTYIVKLLFFTNLIKLKAI